MHRICQALEERHQDPTAGCTGTCVHTHTHTRVHTSLTDTQGNRERMAGASRQVNQSSKMTDIQRRAHLDPERTHIQGGPGMPRCACELGNAETKKQGAVSGTDTLRIRGTAHLL